jgi:hypothetical protein
MLLPQKLNAATLTDLKTSVFADMAGTVSIDARETVTQTDNVLKALSAFRDLAINTFLGVMAEAEEIGTTVFLGVLLVNLGALDLKTSVLMDMVGMVSTNAREIVTQTETAQEASFAFRDLAINTFLGVMAEAKKTGTTASLGVFSLDPKALSLETSAFADMEGMVSTNARVIAILTSNVVVASSAFRDPVTNTFLDAEAEAKRTGTTVFLSPTGTASDANAVAFLDLNAVDSVISASS